MTNKSTFTKEFKLEAIRLLELGETSGTMLARELGIRRNLLYKWQTELNNKGDKAFRGPGRNAAKENKVAVLESENKKLREEVKILKKATAYFAREME